MRLGRSGLIDGPHDRPEAETARKRDIHVEAPRIVERCR
jgi:hypothetical protein